MQFDEIRFQNKIPVSIKFNEKQTDIIDQEVIDLLNENAISVSKFEANQFISNIFIVEKKNGKFTPVMNLILLHITFYKKKLIFVSIYLKDAYLSVPIYKNHRKYLNFFFGKESFINAMH